MSRSARPPAFATVSVGTTPVKLAGSSNSERKILFQNRAAGADIFLLPDNATAAANGYPVAQGQSFVYTGAGELWARTSSGTATVSSVTNAEGIEVIQSGANGAAGAISNGMAEETFHFFIAGAQTAGTKKGGLVVGVACTIVDVRMHADTAPTGASLIADVNKNGTTVFTTQGNRPTIAISGTDSTTVAPDVTALAAGDRLSFDIDQIGSTIAGSDLYVSVTVKRALV